MKKFEQVLLIGIFFLFINMPVIFCTKYFPTNVVINQKGKVYFHTSGLTPGTAVWIKKSIEELKEKSSTAKKL